MPHLTYLKKKEINNRVTGLLLYFVTFSC